MELHRPRPYGTEGNSTRDFLSLDFNSSSRQQDPLPSSSQGAYLKTQNFLQPLERLGKACGKEEIATPIQLSGTGKSTSMEFLRPGGIRTYSISHVSNFNPIVPKVEGSIFRVAESRNGKKNEGNSNSTCFHGGRFSFWEESAGKMGKTIKENTKDKPCLRARISSVSMEGPSQSSKSVSFLEMMKSAKGSPHGGEIEDDDEEFFIKKETSPSVTGELRIKVDGKSSDQKANTPRSKHSATEQRRRSKINDRFQKLRELIPRNDQKRDRASFLLEVVEYIEFLQEKVHKHESSYQGWNHKSTMNSNQRTTHQTRAIHGGSYPTVVFADKFTEKHVSGISHKPVDIISWQAQTPLNHSRSDSTEVATGRDKLKEQDLTIEEGSTISISSVYSQGLLNSLTRALWSSGVDVSKASLSVQIELAKKPNNTTIFSNSAVKDVDIPLSRPGLTRFRVAAAADGSERIQKKLKPGRS